ncbi:MAG: YaiO family outer membrane beta-barrel protein [Burkholderiaceae bacterium]
MTIRKKKSASTLALPLRCCAISIRHLRVHIARYLLALASFLLTSLPLPAHGQDTGRGATLTEPSGVAASPSPITDLLRRGSYLEASFGYAQLTDDNPSWRGAYVKGVWQPDTQSTWYGEVNDAHRFGDHGLLFSAGNTQVINEDWYGSLFAGTSSGGFFLPRYRVDGFINRKWLAERSLVTTLGLGYERAKDVHRDRRLFLGAAYYFSGPWIVEGGGRVNFSDPGSVRAARAFIALTQGRDHEHYAILRVESGREAYQLVGDQSVLSNFSSRVASFTWRQWVGGNRDQGFQVRAERYLNPYYSRSGIEVGIFHDF